MNGGHVPDNDIEPDRLEREPTDLAEDDLRRKVAGFEAEISHMRQQHRCDMTQLREQSASHRALAAREQQERKSLEARLAALDIERTGLLDMLRQERVARQMAESKGHALRRTLSDHKEEVAVLRDALHRIQRKLQEREGDTQTIVEDPTVLSTRYRERCTALEETIQTLEVSLQEAEEALFTAHDDSAVARGEIEALKVQGTQERERYEALQKAYQESEERIALLEDRLGHVEAEMVAQEEVASLLRSELHDAEREHRNASAWASAMEEQSKSLQHLLHAAESRERDIRRKLERQKAADVPELSSRVEPDDGPLQEALHGVGMIHDEITGQIGMLLKLLDKGPAPLQNLERACNDISDLFDRLTAENHRLDQEHDQLIHTLRDQESALARLPDLERQVASSRTRLEEVTGELDRLTRNQEALQLRLQDALANRDRLEQEKSEMAISLRLSEERAGAAESRAEAVAEALENARKRSLTGFFLSRNDEPQPEDPVPTPPPPKPDPHGDEEEDRLLDDLFRSMGFGDRKKR